MLPPIRSASRAEARKMARVPQLIENCFDMTDTIAKLQCFLPL